MTKKAKRFFPTNKGSDIRFGPELKGLGNGWDARFKKVNEEYEIDASKTYSSLRCLLMSLPSEIKMARSKVKFNRHHRLTQMQSLLKPFEALLKEESFEGVSEEQQRVLAELFSAIPEEWEVLRYRKAE